jgi:uncharacterized protein (DUF433 family)
MAGGCGWGNRLAYRGSCGTAATILFLRKNKRMNWKDYIHSDEAILHGKPVIKGTRLSVELILGRLANGWTEPMLFESYPTLPKGAVQAVHAFLLDTIKDDVFHIASIRQAA